MVVVVAVDSVVGWLHSDVTVDDAHQRGRGRLDHGALLDAHPEVVEMPVPLLLLLVPPLFLQHFPLCFLQQLQAIGRQEHVRQEVVLQGTPLILLFVGELVEERLQQRGLLVVLLRLW